jgi:hypothetical protein
MRTGIFSSAGKQGSPSRCILARFLRRALEHQFRQQLKHAGILRLERWRQKTDALFPHSFTSGCPTHNVRALCQALCRPSLTAQAGLVSLSASLSPRRSGLGIGATLMLASQGMRLLSVLLLLALAAAGAQDAKKKRAVTVVSGAREVAIQEWDFLGE